MIGLGVDWIVLRRLYSGELGAAVATEPIPLPALDLSRLTKPVVVATFVVVGFFAGVPPAMMAALGAAVC
jgi:hypothetical protein